MSKYLNIIYFGKKTNYNVLSILVRREAQMDDTMKESRNVISSTDIYTRYCKEIDKEDRLVNDRVNWLLVSQSILFAAVGFAGGSAGEIIAGIVPLVGCALSSAIWLSVVAAISSCLRYRHLLKQTSLLNEGTDRAYPQLNRNPINIWMGYIAPIVMPGVFVVAWAYLVAR